MAGAFAACGCAADFRSSSLNQLSGIPGNSAFSGMPLQHWPEKTFFPAHQPRSVYFRLTVVRFLAKRSVSNTACEFTLNPAPTEGAISRRAQDMKKTFAAFVAVATIAGSLARDTRKRTARPRRGRRWRTDRRRHCRRRHRLQPPGHYGGPVYVEEPAPLPLGSRALLGWLRLALPPRRGLQLIADRPARNLIALRISKPGRTSAGFFLSSAEFSAPR